MTNAASCGGASTSYCRSFPQVRKVVNSLADNGDDYKSFLVVQALACDFPVHAPRITG
jgi:hypothetical protein